MTDAAPAFVKLHEERLAAALAASRPELQGALTRLARAPLAGRSAIDLLLEQELLTCAELQELAAKLSPLSATWGPFEVLAEVGRGKSGVVFRARLAEQEVALKLFRAGGTRPERFQREAELLSRLEHPAIVAVRSAGIEEGQPFLATTWLPGGSLETRGQQPPARAVAWSLRLARGLAYAHAQGVLHRDLSPHNVVLDASEAPVLVDFGLAKDGGGGAEALTGSQHGLGSPAYAAPEQLGAAASAGPPCDAYGLTALLHFLLQGRPPFAGRSWSQLLGQIRRGPAPLPHGPAAPELDALLRWGLDPDPRVRTTLAELARALEDLSAALGR